MASRILIVDDEEMIRENLKAYLEDEGMAVITVSSAEKAFDALRQDQAFDVCIMDMRLPGMDGNTAIHIMHQLASTMRFLIHTGSASYVLPENLQTIGVTERQVFHKPVIDMAVLAEVIRELTQPDHKHNGN